MNIKGLLKGGRYHAPLWGLSCVVPDLLRPGATIADNIEEIGEEQLAVSFTDDLGNVYDIRGWKTPGLAADIAVREVSEERVSEATFSLFHRDISGLFPDLENIHQEFLADGALFAVLRIPRGSNLVDSDSGEALDSTRGCLVRRHGDVALIICAQQSLLEATPGTKMLVRDDMSIEHFAEIEAPLDDAWKALKEKCLQFARTVQLGT